MPLMGGIMNYGYQCGMVWGAALAGGAQAYRLAEAPAGRPDDPTSPLCAVAFKIVTDPHVGHLTWVRVLSGRLRDGQVLLNPRAGVEERVGRIYRMHANKREQVAEVAAGDVVGLVGVELLDVPVVAQDDLRSFGAGNAGRAKHHSRGCYGGPCCHPK